MKFLTNVKNQIFESVRATNCCLYAFLSAFILSGATKIERKLIELPFYDNNTYLFLLHKLEELYSNRVSLEKVNFAGKQLLLISGPSITEFFDDLGFDFVSNKISCNDRIFENDCCKLAFLKGCFIGAGKLYFSEDSNKNSIGYNFELTFENFRLCKIVEKLFALNNLKLKLVHKQNKYLIYTRNSEQISEIMLLFGAVKASLDFENELALRTVKNNLNRQNNCYDANQNKTLNASFEHLQAIEKIKKKIGLEKLPVSLQKVADLRLKYPDASLSELCKFYSSDITRAGMKYKLDRIKFISKKIKE